MGMQALGRKGCGVCHSVCKATGTDSKWLPAHVTQGCLVPWAHPLPLLPRRTCHTGHPQCFLVLWRLGAVLAALLAPRGPGAAEVDLCGLEEGHHEGLLVLGPVSPNQAGQLRVDALP
jgi:hypothetical protein